MNAQVVQLTSVKKNKRHVAHSLALQEHLRPFAGSPPYTVHNEKLPADRDEDQRIVHGGDHDANRRVILELRGEAVFCGPDWSAVQCEWCQESRSGDGHPKEREESDKNLLVVEDSSDAEPE